MWPWILSKDNERTIDTFIFYKKTTFFLNFKLKLWKTSIFFTINSSEIIFKLKKNQFLIKEAFLELRKKAKHHETHRTQNIRHSITRAFYRNNKTYIIIIFFSATYLQFHIVNFLKNAFNILNSISAAWFCLVNSNSSYFLSFLLLFNKTNILLFNNR